jgi:hypothetical protein
LLQGLSTGGFHLRQLESSNIEDSDHVEVLATRTAFGRCDGVPREHRRPAEPETSRDHGALGYQAARRNKRPVRLASD